MTATSDICAQPVPDNFSQYAICFRQPGHKPPHRANAAVGTITWGFTNEQLEQSEQKLQKLVDGS